MSPNGLVMEITVEQMMKIENNGHDMGFLKKFMMENAGAAAVKRLIDHIPDISSKNILVFAGLGNNGGDGLVMARHLAGYGSRVSVFLLGEESDIKTEESQWNWKLLKKMNSLHLFYNTIPKSIDEFDVIIDGILGTGISGDIREPYSSAITMINQAKAFKLAVDVPSGLDPNSGKTANIFVKSDITITFHKMKIGMTKRKDICGEIYVEKIGIPPEAEVGVL